MSLRSRSTGAPVARPKASARALAPWARRQPSLAGASARRQAGLPVAGFVHDRLLRRDASLGAGADVRLAGQDLQLHDRAR